MFQWALVEIIRWLSIFHEEFWSFWDICDWWFEHQNEAIQDLDEVPQPITSLLPKHIRVLQGSYAFKSNFFNKPVASSHNNLRETPSPHKNGAVRDLWLHTRHLRPFLSEVQFQQSCVVKVWLENFLRHWDPWGNEPMADHNWDEFEKAELANISNPPPKRHTSEKSWVCVSSVISLSTWSISQLAFARVNESIGPSTYDSGHTW